jgi:LCP family protein required for cell wall assembly
LFAYVRYRYGQVRKVFLPGLVHHGHDPAGAAHSEKGMTILLVGNNTRAGLDPREAKQFGTADEVGGARSDVTMLLHLDPAKGASLLSVPRDLFVPMPPHSRAGAVGKIDAALNDGPEQLVEAITNDLGIPIDHYVSVNFDGFQHVVDSLGGVDMSFPTPLRDSFSGLKINQTGCNHLGGAAALSVVRARHLQYMGPNGRWVDDPQSDLGRIRRNHEFLTVFAKTMKARGITNPLRANAVMGNLVHQVTIDSGLGAGTMVKLLRRYRNLNPDTVPQLTLPVTLVPQANYRYGGGTYGSVVFPSQPADAQVIATFLGVTPPQAPPSQVSVVDRSTTGAGRRVSEGLAAAGFPVTGLTHSAVMAHPSETVIRYHPGELPAAERLLASLSGAAVMYADAQTQKGALVLDVGSVVTVAGPSPAPGTSPNPSPPSPASPTSPPARRATAASNGASPTVSSTIPTPGGQPITASVTPPQSFDPRGC